MYQPHGWYGYVLNIHWFVCFCLPRFVGPPMPKCQDSFINILPDFGVQSFKDHHFRNIICAKMGKGYMIWLYVKYGYLMSSFLFDKHVQLAQNSWINSVLDPTIPEIDQPKRNASFWANYSHLSRGYLQWSFSRESHQKSLNLGLGIIVICPAFEH